MKNTAGKVEWSGELPGDDAESCALHAHFIEGHLGRDDRALRRLTAGLWLRRIYLQSHPDAEPLGGAQGFEDAQAPYVTPASAQAARYHQTAIALGPEFGVLYQACCLNRAARPSLLCRALDRLADWRGV